MQEALCETVYDKDYECLHEHLRGVTADCLVGSKEAVRKGRKEKREIELHYYQAEKRVSGKDESCWSRGLIRLFIGSSRI